MPFSAMISLHVFTLMQLSVLIIDKTFHQIVLESDNFYYGHNFAQEKLDKGLFLTSQGKIPVTQTFFYC